MPNSKTQMAFLITTLLGFAKTTAASDTISDEYEMREAFDTPLIDSFFHIMPKYDYSQSVSDFVLDHCLSAMDDKTNTGTRLPIFIEFLLRRLRIIKSYERKNKTPEYLRRSYNTLIARLWVSSKGMMHLTSLRQFYSNDLLPFVTWASLCKMFDQNKVLRKHLQVKYAEIYRMNASMSRFYRYSDRFTGLLTFANANDCKIELILRFLQSFYEVFFGIVEKAHKDFLISKNDDVATDFDDLLSKFDTERLHLRKNSFAKINFSIQTIRNLSYAYFIFQIILYNQRPRASSLNIKYILNDFNYSLDQYNMNHKAPLAKQNKASLEALNLHYAKFKGKETDILADYFAYHGTIISLTEKEKTDEEILVLFDRIVANYEKTMISK